MDEIADLIRLWAEAPAEEPPMSRPREFLSRVAIEKVAQEGVVQPGPAVPNAQPKSTSTDAGPDALVKTNPVDPGRPSIANLLTPEMIRPAAPIVPDGQVGAVANPRTGIPVAGMPVKVTPIDRNSGLEAEPVETPQSVGRSAVPVAPAGASNPPSLPAVPTPESGRPAEPIPKTLQAGRSATPQTPQPSPGPQAEPVITQPVRAGEARVMAPETFSARMATPRIFESMAGIPANVRNNQTIQGVASPTPNTQVTITVPPAFPLDPQRAFEMVDEQVQLPPRVQPLPVRDIPVDTFDLQLESTETLVARSYQQVEGNRSDTDRWQL